MAAYSTAVLDDIRAAVDIVDLVGRFVNLKKAGVNWKGLCPFHGEKTPSFMVNPKKGIFHCFGCGVGGDVFGFVMRQDRLSFPEAVRMLAKSAGVALPDDRPADAADSGREELLRAMELASQFYVETLWAPAGERARVYLEQRGIDGEVARRFGLGFAPEGWDALLTAMKGSGVNEATLVAAGLAVPRENRAGAYDRFRGRLLFAIRDLQGRAVAFGGRAFGDEQPKYLNSPETPLYTKGNLLYAADVARESIRTRNRALIVEGYVDCLMAHQHGFTETVAALGTAFTGAQLGLLRRYCDEVVTFFDADAAGQKAAERAEELLEPSTSGMTWGVNRSGAFDSAGSLRVKVALLPAGHDPDTFLREQGAAAFTERIAAARSLLSYALDRTITAAEGGDGARGRTNLFARVALMLAKVTDAAEAASLAREAALKLGVDATQLWIEAQRLSTSLRKPAPAARVTVNATATAPAVERDLVMLLLSSMDARRVLLPVVEDADVSHPALREILQGLRRSPGAAPAALLAELSGEPARHALSALLVEEHLAEDPRASIEQYTRRLDRAQRLRRMRIMGRTIAEAQQTTGVAAAVDDQLRAMHEDGAGVYGFGGGTAQSLEHGPEGPQGVHTHE
jgi:DNA primase